MSATHRPTRPWWPIAAASTWMATVLNAALWRELHALDLLRGPGGALFALALAAIVGLLLFALMSLLAWRWTLKPVLVGTLCVAAVGCYFMLAYHVVLDPGMLANALQTDRHEAAALLTPWLPAAMAIFLLPPAWWLGRMRIEYRPPLAQLVRNLGAVVLALIAAAAVALAAFQPLASAMRNHKQLRYLLNPLNTVWGLGQLAAAPLRRPRALRPIGLDAQSPPAGARPPLLVLVIGETARSGNFGINGYLRPTTPRLAQQDVASWRNVWSCGTSTAASLPCMFSHLGREGFERRDEDYENLLDVLRRAGLAVLWLDNQGGCKGVCDRVLHASTAGLRDPALCRGDGCLDGILLQGLDARLAALPAASRSRGVVLVLHQMGSHGPAYWQRSPEGRKPFAPECRSVHLQDCDRSELVNAYDNSIAYTDRVLADAIEWLKTQEGTYAPALVYVADHGESLGEGNLYLHGLPYGFAPDVQKRVPWITWLSPGFSLRTGLTAGCLQRLRDERLSHDHFFHAVLGLLQVRTALYQQRLDPYADCASH